MTGCVELHRRAGDPAVLPVPRSGQHQRQCRAVSERPPSGPGVPNHAHHEDTEAGSPFHRTTVTGIHAPAQLQGTVIGLALHCEAETHTHTHTHTRTHARTHTHTHTHLTALCPVLPG